MRQSDRNSRLYDALKNNNREVLNEQFNFVRQALVDYLVFTRGADKPSAEDAVSVAFVKLLEAIKDDRIKEKGALYKWLLMTCKSVYRDEKNKILNQVTEADEFNEEVYIEPAEQVDLMQDPERNHFLKLCMDLLTEDMRVTIDYLIKFPDISLAKASEHLKVSYITLRRRKSRITHQLHNCVQEKLQGC